MILKLSIKNCSARRNLKILLFFLITKKILHKISQGYRMHVIPKHRFMVKINPWSNLNISKPIFSYCHKVKQTRNQITNNKRYHWEWKGKPQMGRNYLHYTSQQRAPVKNIKRTPEIEKSGKTIDWTLHQTKYASDQWAYENVHSNINHWQNVKWNHVSPDS